MPTILTDDDMFRISKATNAAIRIIARPTGKKMKVIVHDISVPDRVLHAFDADTDDEALQVGHTWMAEHFKVEYRPVSDVDKLSAKVAELEAKLAKMNVKVEK